jgi:hypothetical protein
MNDERSLEYRKSSYSTATGNCVEVAFEADGAVHVRDSKDRTGPVLAFTPAEWSAFRSGVVAGEFTLPS